MPKWLKIVLIILGISILICGGGAITCGILAKNKMEEFAGDAEAAKKYGAEHNGKECLDEALNKTQKCGDVKSMSGIACLTNTTIFFQSCMEATSDKKALCDAAEYKPNEGELHDDWMKRICAAKGMKDNEGCQSVVAQMRTHCVYNDAAGPQGQGGGQEMPEETPPAEEKPTE